jgi:16S rRNA (guanine527-N7)-methyltransferase
MTDPTSPTSLVERARALGAELRATDAERLLAYLDAMLAENAHVNLTAVREREAAVLFHALDSVVLARAALDAPPGRALDLGTGNGFPGVAIACVFPRARVVLMDRTLKKLKAIERALAAAGFDAARFETIQMDAGEAPARGYKSAFDLIATRGVGPPAAIAPLAKPLLVRGGQLLCWLSDDAEAPAQLKGALKRVRTVEYVLPSPAGRKRRLVQYGRGA